MVASKGVWKCTTWVWRCFLATVVEGMVTSLSGLGGCLEAYGGGCLEQSNVGGDGGCVR